MRPGNYAHEKWPYLSRLIGCYKNRLRNKYYRAHHDSKGSIRAVCLTQSQSVLYDHMIEISEEGKIDPNKIEKKYLNIKSLEQLITKHKLFKVGKNYIYIL